jgi:uncharacterized coiled-coil protein SlyX
MANLQRELNNPDDPSNSHTYEDNLTELGEVQQQIHDFSAMVAESEGIVEELQNKLNTLSSSANTNNQDQDQDQTQDNDEDMTDYDNDDNNYGNQNDDDDNTEDKSNEDDNSDDSYDSYSDID